MFICNYTLFEYWISGFIPVLSNPYLYDNQLMLIYRDPNKFSLPLLFIVLILLGLMFQNFQEYEKL